MNTKEALSIWNELKNEIKNIIQEELKAYVKWVPMKVIVANNTTKKATVRQIYGDENGSQDYVDIPNNSGVNLVAGDNVYIAYAYSPANAIIVFKAP